VTGQMQVVVEGNAIVIRIPFEYLIHSAQTHQEFYDDDWDNRLVVDDVGVFANEVMQSLREESEDGTTVVHVALDEAIANAVENGAEGVTLLEEVLYEDEDDDEHI
jgi:hypothetical protein